MEQYGFTLERDEEISELTSTARLWRHAQSGAELLSFSNSDENKVFGVSFRTPPADSTGVAHILEHSVLCGSEKYPVKEPFVELLKGSLQTFLNAFTYPDKTCYPVASANLNDFRNLVDVYLDAVFFPRITEDIFHQEGWHLAPEGDDFIFKGVVYNEMKGAFSSPESVLSRHCLHALFPDTVYALESGGDPKDIPSLSFKAFRAFHSKYYHPSNARFFFWGDDPEEERLARLASLLERFSVLQPDSAVDLQTPLGTPRRLSVPYAASKDDAHMVVVNWLGPDVMDIEAVLAFQMLEHILLGMPASPLRRALIESGLGEDLAGQGLETELRQLCFDAGLKGVAQENVEAVEQLVLDSLRTLVEQGIAVQMAEAAVNSVEFALRENNSGRFPVGLSVMLRSLTTWLHNGDPLAPLRFEAPLAAIKAALARNERYFETLITRWLIDNPHRVTVVLAPDPGLGQKQELEER
ncbi:insulinase family protein, partial [Desulfovibrio sp. OttesenSCG-928-M16]|nr:insulinase family protein [Desulfovibrio sp. OttesenSCG-928-M16]